MWLVAIGLPAVETVGGLTAARRIVRRTGFTVIRNLFIAAASLVLLAPAAASAFDVEQALRELQPGYDASQSYEPFATQGGCMSLNDAIESVRSRGDVERIISAETKGNMHHIRYVTKDGTVRTAKIRACS